MKKPVRFFTFALLALVLLLSSCAPVTPIAPPESQEAAPTETTAAEENTPPVLSDETQPYEIVGSFSYSNDILTDYYVEQAVALVDMYGFVIRDKEWEIPVASQTLGYLKLDMDTQTGTYTVQLPARPTATQVDVDNDGNEDAGVQIFAVSYWPNLTGGPYSVGDDRSTGWPTYLASIITDTENEDEIIGGNLIVWAPDSNQKFPSGFGEDGKLFTEDDPVSPIPQGYTIVNLDSEPFSQTKEPTPSLTLYEPKDIAIKDFSNLSYTEAFDKMFEIVRKEYAFNGIEGKAPDWDALYAEIKPRIEKAEADNDPDAFALALRDFTWAFKDGHVGMSMTQSLYDQFLRETEGGYGFAIRELDDGRFIVTYLMEDGPAAKAGIELKAEITAFNGVPISEALATVKPWSLPMSTDKAIRYQQARYLLRAQPGDEADITFINPDGEETTVTLTAISERESFSVTSIYADAPEYVLPVEFEILDSGVGYVRINSNYDDLNLIIRLFERALKTFEEADVPGIIIDMRYNSGGAPLGLAGFLYDKEITMGQLEYYSEKTGQFEPEGLPEKVYPNETQYHFDKEVLLVGQACYSACEIESYGFSQVPGMIVIGESPSGGTEAEVARGQFVLPDNLTLQIPTGRFVLPDGSIFLEGQGVQPTLRVPVNEETVFATGDIVLQTAENAILRPLGAGITPSAPPKMATPEETMKRLQEGTSPNMLEDEARETYTEDDMAEMGRTFTYTIPISSSQELMWAWGWCASDEDTLEQNFEHIAISFTLDGEEIPIENFASLDYAPNGQSCRAFFTILSDWTVGEHHLSSVMTIDAPINDGALDFPAGTQTFEYAVYVKP